MQLWGHIMLGGGEGGLKGADEFELDILFSDLQLLKFVYDFFSNRYTCLVFVSSGFFFT